MKEQYEFLFGLIENPSEEQKEEMKKKLINGDGYVK